LILFDAAAFELTDAESRALSSTLAAHFAEDGWDLRQRHPQRWYLSGGRPQDLITLPLPAVRGAAIPARAFTGGDAPAWINRLNETQMLMHDHPVNRARAVAGQVPVNSLWVWGGGDPHCQGQAQCHRVCSDNIFARGGARYCSVALSALADDADSMMASLSSDDHLLIVLEDCRDAAAYEDVTAWQAAVSRLEHDWFSGLIRALKTGRLDALELFPLNGTRYRLTRWQLLSFWKGRGDYRNIQYRGANRV
jgi:hypothetical protein